MKRIVLLHAVALLIAAPVVLATSYSNIVSITTIETVDTTGVARVFLGFSARPFVTSCSLDNPTQVWRLGGTPENQKNLLAIATAARLADRQVEVLFVNSYSGNASCDTGGTNGYPVVSGLMLL